MNSKRSFYKRIIAVTAVFALVFAWSFVCFPECSYAASGVKIGQATSGDHGSRGNKAGDQSGSEVSVSNWSYGRSSDSPFHWNYVFRAKDPMLGLQLAKNMKAAAANNHVGYDKGTPDRYTFYDAAKSADWNIEAVATNCETTCASAVSVCLNAAGVRVPRLWFSEIVYEDIMATGLFDCYRDSAYTASSANLLPGDILLAPTHTAMVVESPNHFTFRVTYSDTKGKEDVAYVEETSNVQLNPNNGEKIYNVEVKGDIDLKDYTPEKADGAFLGWEKVDDNSYSAQYASYAAPIAIPSGEADSVKSFSND